MGIFNRRRHPSYHRPMQATSNTPYNRAAQMAQQNNSANTLPLKDYGPNPFAIHIDSATKSNPNFRTTLWTGPFLQITLMSIPPGGEIGLEMHSDVDQFIRLEDGEGLVMMVNSPNNLDFKQRVGDGDAFVIPSNTWHNLINIANTPIKLYSIYTPPQHPFNTVHETKADADAAEN